VTEADEQIKSCAREIISSHVLARDAGLRDRLIDEYATMHGPSLLTAVYSYIYNSVVTPVGPRTAQVCFHFMLNSLGNLIQAVADLGGFEPEVIAIPLARVRVTPAAPGDPEDVKVVDAVRAAQTCLIVHLAQRGPQPLSIQFEFELLELHAVIQALGNLTWTFIGWMRDAIGDAQLIRELLDGVEDILAMGASAAEVPLSEFVADNFTRMAASGWGPTEDVG
jgi:hypothetical protein